MQTIMIMMAVLSRRAVFAVMFTPGLGQPRVRVKRSDQPTVRSADLANPGSSGSN